MNQTSNKHNTYTTLAAASLLAALGLFAHNLSVYNAQDDAPTVATMVPDSNDSVAIWQEQEFERRANALAELAISQQQEAEFMALNIPESRVASISVVDANIKNEKVLEYDELANVDNVYDEESKQTVKTVIFDPESFSNVYTSIMRVDTDLDDTVDLRFGKIGLKDGELRAKLLFFMHSNSQGYGVGDNIGNVHTGSRIKITSEDGITYYFRVTNITTPDKKDPQAIFNNATDDITMFTCYADVVNGNLVPNNEIFYLVKATFAKAVLADGTVHRV